MTKKLLSLNILAFLFALFCNAQTTSYYRLTRKIIDGVSSTNVSGGQFITFNGNKCYESDKQGYSVDNGSLKYQETTDGISIYYGTSYWGDSFFRFNSDKSVMNVSANGNQYVYKRTTAPVGVSTCSLIKGKSSSGQTIVSTPIDNGGGYINNGGYHTNTIPDRNSTSSKTLVKVWHNCPLCNGTGRIEKNLPVSILPSNDYKKYCSECGRSWMASMGHCHLTCSQCHGKKGYYTEEYR